MLELVKLGPIVGKCPQCEGPLYREVDSEDRRWLTCYACGARFPLDSGLHTTSEEGDEIVLLNEEEAALFKEVEPG